MLSINSLEANIDLILVKIYLIEGQFYLIKIKMYELKAIIYIIKDKIHLLTRLFSIAHRPPVEFKSPTAPRWNSTSAGGRRNNQRAVGFSTELPARSGFFNWTTSARWAIEKRRAQTTSAQPIFRDPG